MTEPKFRNVDGTLTAYAFACGYVESFTLDGKDYYGSDMPGVMLYRDGMWHVKAHNAPFGAVPSVWNSFDTLTDARKAFRRYRAAIKKGLDVVTVDEEN